MSLSHANGRSLPMLRRGTTLIEMVVYCTMVGVLTGIAFWKLDITQYALTGDMQVVGTTLIAAQREAVAKQHNLIIAFDQTGNELQIVFDRNNNGRLDQGVERYRTVFLGDRVHYGIGTAPAMPWGAQPINFVETEGTSGNPSVTFLRNGSASEAGGIYLTSARAESDPRYAHDARAIRVDRATGRIEWWHYDGAAWVRGF